MIDAINLKPGMYYRKAGSLYEVVSATRTQMQQRRSSIRVKARDLDTGKSSEHVFRADEIVDQVVPEEAPLTYLYSDGEHLHFMNEATYEQIELSQAAVGDKRYYLKESATVTGIIFEGHVLDLKFPLFLEARVTETDPGFRGDTVTGAKKPATLETGLVVQVPLFIEVGTTIRVDTRTGEYVTRV